MKTSPEISPEILSSNPQFSKPKHHTRLQWVAKFRAMPFCHYCEKPLTLLTATKDHLTPTCRGGSDLISNVVPACLECNQKKAWRTEGEYRTAQQAISTLWEKSRAISKARSGTSADERYNEPGLLKKVVTEREKVSWAWRNPA